MYLSTQLLGDKINFRILEELVTISNYKDNVNIISNYKDSVNRRFNIDGKYNSKGKDKFKDKDKYKEYSS